MIYYSPYFLTPKKKLNATADFSPKRGLFVKVEAKGEVGYADYFPHADLGDLPIEEILKGARDESFEKALWFARNENELKKRPFAAFQNHHLCHVDTIKENFVCKVKLNGVQDLSRLKERIPAAKRLRLDANGSISFDEWMTFLKSLPMAALQKIEYVEDPGVGDWSLLPVPSAKDFMKSQKWNYLVYKANARFCEERERETAVFSSYMGSDLGRFQCYLELNNFGNLDLVHGVDTPGLYEEQMELFEVKEESWSCRADVVKKIYEKLESKRWSPLC